ncbi:MAG: thioredoxin family protein [Verrucomicrobia bacterium]|nr:thioredoxin family protein [Verrucomicrobiota bacterium]
MKIVIVGALAMAVAGVVVLKQAKPPGESPTETAVANPSGLAAGTVTNAPPAAASARLPRLVDLGAGKCIPCKMMKPILEELERDYANRFVTEFIDVWENPDAGKEYGVEMIPTQIFYDAQGQERFRHVGFYGKEDILDKWTELGVKAEDGSAAGTDR